MIADFPEIIENETLEIETNSLHVQSTYSGEDLATYQDKQHEKMTITSSEPVPEDEHVHEEIEGTSDSGNENDTHRTGKRKLANSRIKNKKLRMQGKKYLGIKKDQDGKQKLCAEKSEKILCPRHCTNRCKKGWGGRKCNETDETTRTEIFQMFWDTLNWREKKIYIVNLVEKKGNL